MKSAPLILGFCLLATGLLAAAPHPTVLRVKFKNQMLAVVRVHGDEPYVLMDGKETLIRSTPVYFLENAESYSDNFIETTHGSMGGRMTMKVLGDHYLDDRSGGVSGAIIFEVPMTAQKTIKGGFVSIAMVTSLGFGEIIVHELPELPAGQTVKVKLEVHQLPSSPNPVFFAQVFDAAGREVRTSDMGVAWEYYAQRDRARLTKAVEAYVKKYANADHEAVPAFTPGPVFKPHAKLPTGEVTVMLSILEDGTVSSVDAGMIENDSARDSVIEALSGWLFLPKLKAGQPVSTFINVPLGF